MGKIVDGESYLALGLMSGTSVDAVDAALTEVRFVGRGVSSALIGKRSHEIPADLREVIFSLFEDGPGSLHRASLLNFRIGELFADAALALLAECRTAPAEITIIGSHGQTIHHVSEREECCGKVLLGTMQIGEGSVIAQRTGIPTATDFRTADLAAGGAGAPLVAMIDALLLTGELRTAVQNIGGIGNVTWIDGPDRLVLAFDTGPGNMIVDLLAARLSRGGLAYDRDGELGRRGRVRTDLLQRWLAHPFFKKNPPKTAGREEFGAAFVRDYIGGIPPSVDLVRTAEEFTALSIASAYRDFLPSPPCKTIVTGGGVRNPVILAALRKNLPAETTVITGEEAGLDSDFKEAAAFALLGLLCLLHRPGNLPTATGAERSVVLGKLSFP